MSRGILLKKLFNSVVKILFLDLGNSRFSTTYFGSYKVNDLILEKMPNTDFIVYFFINHNSNYWIVIWFIFSIQRG